MSISEVSRADFRIFHEMIDDDLQAQDGIEWNFESENYWQIFYDDVLYRDDPNLWSNEELKIKRIDLKLTLVTL